MDFLRQAVVIAEVAALALVASGASTKETKKDGIPASSEKFWTLCVSGSASTDNIAAPSTIDIIALNQAHDDLSTALVFSSFNNLSTSSQGVLYTLIHFYSFITT